MPELLFMLGSPRSAAGSGEGLDLWDAMACANWVEARTTLAGSTLVTSESTWSAALLQTQLLPGVCAADPDDTADAALPLTDLLGCVAMQCGVNIHLVGTSDWQRTVECIHDAIYRSGWHHTQFLVSARGHRMLNGIRRCDAHIKTGLVVGDTPGYCAELAAEAGAYSVHIDMPYVGIALVRQCHDRGLVVIAHGANDIPHIEALARMGVDGIATRYPQRYLRWHRAAYPQVRDPVALGVCA